MKNIQHCFNSSTQGSSLYSLFLHSSTTFHAFGWKKCSQRNYLHHNCTDVMSQLFSLDNSWSLQSTQYLEHSIDWIFFSKITEVLGIWKRLLKTSHSILYAFPHAEHMHKEVWPLLSQHLLKTVFSSSELISFPTCTFNISNKVSTLIFVVPFQSEGLLGGSHVHPVTETAQSCFEFNGDYFWQAK